MWRWVNIPQIVGFIFTSRTLLCHFININLLIIKLNKRLAFLKLHFLDEIYGISTWITPKTAHKQALVVLEENSVVLQWNSNMMTISRLEWIRSGFSFLTCITFMSILHAFLSHLQFLLKTKRQQSLGGGGGKMYVNRISNIVLPSFEVCFFLQKKVNCPATSLLQDVSELYMLLAWIVLII